jgi:POT family proton-dependent oligopeptide transporter
MSTTPPAARDWFGHPKGLTILAGTEVWERFSFYGMQALLMLYMTKYLLLPEHASRVLGLAGFRNALTVFGPMTDLAFASLTYGLYSGLTYATPLIGAWLGDQVFGKTKTVTAGALLMAAGHLAMALEHLFLIALTLIILGAGCVIGNMAAQVGKLYARDDERRTRAFALYLLALNIGALVAPLIIGTLGEDVGWHWGFGAAGIGMFLGLIVYLSGRKYLPPDIISKRGDHAKLTGPQWRKIVAIVAILIPYALGNAALNQAYGIMYVWADTAVDRHIFGWEMPVTWIGTFDGLMTMLGVVIAGSIWKRTARRDREPGDVAKLAIGLAGIGAAYLFIAPVALLHVTPLILWLVFFVILDFATSWYEAPPQSLISRNAPLSVNATMMAVFKLASAFGYFMLGWMGRFYEPLGPALYWVLTASLALAGAGLLLLMKRPVERVFAVQEPEEAINAT